VNNVVRTPVSVSFGITGTTINNTPCNVEIYDSLDASATLIFNDQDNLNPRAIIYLDDFYETIYIMIQIQKFGLYYDVPKFPSSFFFPSMDPAGEQVDDSIKIFWDNESTGLDQIATSITRYTVTLTYMNTNNVTSTRTFESPTKYTAQEFTITFEELIILPKDGATVVFTIAYTIEMYDGITINHQSQPFGGSLTFEGTFDAPPLPPPTNFSVNVGSSTASITWTGVVGFANRIKLISAQSTVTINPNDINPETYTFTNLTPDTDYTVEIYTRNGDVVSTSLNGEFRTTVELTLDLSSDDNFLVKATWSDTGAASYTLSYYITTGGAAGNTITETISGLTFTIDDDDLTPSTSTVEKLVSVTVSDGTSSITKTYVMGILPALTLTGSLAGTVMYGFVITVNWTAITGADSYQIRAIDTYAAIIESPITTEFTTTFGDGISNDNKYTFGSRYTIRGFTTDYETSSVDIITPFD
jgi:hypothetical protein